MASESTLGWARKDISVLQEPDEIAFYHMLHGFANTAIQRNMPVTSCEGAIRNGFQDGNSRSFSSGRRE
jgi:hypothetical protein